MGSALVNCERVSGTWLFTAASVIVCFVQCVCLAGCTNSNEPSTSSDPYVGSWSGSFDDRAVGRGTAQVSWQNTAQLDGTWSATFTGFSPGGSVSLVPSGAPSADLRRQFIFACGPPPTGGTLVLSVSLSGSAVQGTYLAVACGDLTNGVVSLTRR